MRADEANDWIDLISWIPAQYYGLFYEKAIFFGFRATDCTD